MTMEHAQAQQQMAVERYLLDELDPQEREAFESHAFDCAQCSADLRSTARFLAEVKRQLPMMEAAPVARLAPPPRRRARPPWLQPVMGLAAAAVLAVALYQSAVVIPGLRARVTQPGLVPWTLVRAETRSADRLHVAATRESGALLLVELPPAAGGTAFEVALLDAQARTVWSSSVQPSELSEAASTVSLLIPADALAHGPYTLLVTRPDSAGEHHEVDRRALDIQFDH